jgi:hypothetical protein
MNCKPVPALLEYITDRELEIIGEALNCILK